MIYADNAATSGFVPQSVQDAVFEYLKHPGNPGHSACANSMQAARQVYSARKTLAQYFHCAPERVIFTSGATEALNLAIHAAIKPGDEVLVCEHDHNSTLRPLKYYGARIILTDGTIEDMRKKLTPDTKAVVLSHVSNVTGRILDIKDISRFCQEYNLIFILDGAQSAGILDIDLEKTPVDYFCFAGHKGMHGLQGTGGLCIKDGINPKPLITGGTGSHSFELDMPKVFPDYLEAGTHNVPGIVSLQAGVKYIQSQEDILCRLQHLARIFISELEDLRKAGKIDIYADPDSPGIVSLNIKNTDPAYVGYILDDKYHIQVRTGAHCAPLIHQKLGIEGSVRFSFGLNNTEDEILTCARAVKDIAEAGAETQS